MWFYFLKAVYNVTIFIFLIGIVLNIENKYKLSLKIFLYQSILDLLNFLENTFLRAKG